MNTITNFNFEHIFSKDGEPMKSPQEAYYTNLSDKNDVIIHLYHIYD